MLLYQRFLHLIHGRQHVIYISEKLPVKRTKVLEQKMASYIARKDPLLGEMRAKGLFATRTLQKRAAAQEAERQRTLELERSASMPTLGPQLGQKRFQIRAREP